MIYLSGLLNDKVRALCEAGVLGMILAPHMSMKHAPGAWAADNGCFNRRTYVGDEAWWQWLERKAEHVDTCLFATAPDVVGDHEATLTRSTPWLARIRSLGYPAAFVAQDGAQVDSVPWDQFDVLFLGGSTDWKLGADARELTAHAVALGMPVHMGRVNSHRRLRYAAQIGCSSADGTYLAFGPDVNLPRLVSWVRDVNDQLDLLEEADA